MINESGEQLITGIDIREFFQDSVTSAVTNQNITISDETLFYIVNLLTSFIHSENFFDKTEDGLAIKPLALVYAESLGAESVEDKYRALQRLGDIALFISGLFSDSLNRSLVDIDYYIAMGENAYGHLADSTRTCKGKFISHVFAELATKFIRLVDVLGDVGENPSMPSDSDILRTYEVWLKTGSQRASRKLEKIGIHPVSVNINKH